MEKIEVALNEIEAKVAELYSPDKWILNMVNALDLGDKLEIQWFFSSYLEKNKIICFYAYAGYDEEIPSIASIIPSAWVSENECRDLAGAMIKNTKKGLFLEDDMDFIPLRKNQGAQA